MDTPLSESAFIGAAIGAAACGMRPIAELMFLDFMGVCFDQIFNQAAKFKYMFGGKAETPVVIRGMVGGGFPIFDEQGEVIGGIGASGGTIEEDCEACLVGMRKLGFKTEFANPLAAPKK